MRMLVLHGYIFVKTTSYNTSSSIIDTRYNTCIDDEHIRMKGILYFLKSYSYQNNGDANTNEK